MDNFYALVLAGGKGSRLWPMSQPNRPKPLLYLGDEQSLFQKTLKRLAGLFSSSETYVVCPQNLKSALHAQAPELPASSFILEPSSRNTAPAIALGVFQLAHDNPDAIVAVLSSDHYIEKTEQFVQALCEAYHVAQQGYIVTIGIQPSYPAVGYGYIEHGQHIYQNNEWSAYQVNCFTEKPDIETAKHFLATGAYSWDGGILVASAQSIKEEFVRWQPQAYEILTAISTGDFALWEKLPNISFDYAIMEKSQRVAVLPVELGWNDIGTWRGVYEILPKDANLNAITPSTQATMIQTQGSLISSHKPVVTIGINDLIVIDTPDALLICAQDAVQQVKAFN